MVKLMNIIEFGIEITPFGIKISLVAQLVWTDYRCVLFGAYCIMYKSRLGTLKPNTDTQSPLAGFEKKMSQRYAIYF